MRTKASGGPALPPGAEREILERLSTAMCISSDEIAAILKKHGVHGDGAALQDAYRKRLGQRFMASIRDEQGRRELFAVGREYVIVDCCNDPKQLRAIQRRFQSSMTSLDVSAKKVRGRMRFLDRFAPDTPLDNS